MHYRRWLRHGDVDRLRRSAPTTCQAESCERLAEACGLCHGHYLRMTRTGDVRPHDPLTRTKNTSVCSVPGCDRPAKRRGICNGHYKRLMRHGDVLAHVPVRRRTNDGSLNSGGYRKVPVPEGERHLTQGRGSEAEHRLVMARHLGRPLRPGEVVHHVNGIRTDNRIENLELMSSVHPKGQRVADKVDHAIEVLRIYRPDLLADP